MANHTLLTELDAANYKFLQQHVYAQAGIVLEEDKRYLFESRLSPIVRQMGLQSINDLCALVKATRDSGIGRQVAEAMTTNETFFFRDHAHYEAIRTSLVPALKQLRGDSKRMRFWSAAASTGQEAYSLAMLLAGEGLAGWDLQIFGTDFSAQVLARARAGKFQQIEVNRGLPASLLVKHFHRAGVEWQLNHSIRDMVKFEQRDLRHSARSLGPFDLVFCRNVLIYFDTATKKKILQEIHSTLYRGGWFLLGGSEAMFAADEWFERTTVAGATVYVAR